MFIEAMATHEVLTKNFFESNLKKKSNITFPNTYDYGLESDE
jgi:hypothetical protein